ncbi:KamA family radical SAM protein [Streptomyces sp. NPDC058011]|uniref:KamA family radical SAM protein n=1 Tax=Streptomyces sp. NPDC058011 TaxID=3346305 RepID=UPI0036E73D7A
MTVTARPTPQRPFGTTRYRALSLRDVTGILTRRGVGPQVVEDVHAVGSVLPFRVNDHVLEHLIDWDDIPGDPMYQLLFPQPGMLDATDLATMRQLSRDGSTGIGKAAAAVRARMNPHPGGQLELNRPRVHDEVLSGLQHKYAETVLYFPRNGQTCHAYCTYCFRWAQFVGDSELRMGASDPHELRSYLLGHPEVRNVLVTGGDPLIMSTAVLRRHVEPLLDPALDQLEAVRIGTKSLTFWPARFLTDFDASDLLRLLEQVVAAGRALVLVAHISHPRELEPAATREAIRLIRATGATVYCQAPLVAHVNDRAEVWERLWNAEVRLGCVPYYMFVERDTGPRRYFEVPLVRAHDIFTAAYRRSSGLARTVKGPVMSATPGKVLLDGYQSRDDGDVTLQLRFAQARDPEWVGRPFTARATADATWFSHLQPADAGQNWWYEDLATSGDPA